MAVTKLENLIDPQVIADFVEKKLVDAIKFAPLAVIDNTLVGKAGDKLDFPVWSYIGDASAVEEAGEITVANLGQTKASVTVSKLGKGVGFTDEAVLSGLGGDGISEEAVKQIVLAIASKVDTTLLTEMEKASLTYAYSATDKGAVNVAKALEKFGEDMEGEKVLLIAPDQYSKIMGEIVPNTDAGATILKTGNVGQIMGCQVVISNRLIGKKEAFIVKPGALRIVSKRDTLVEFDRDKSTQTNYVYGSKIYAPYLYDATKIVKITLA